MLAFLAIYLLCMMKLPAIFQVFEHLNDFQTSAMVAILFFLNDAKILHIFIAINILCKFDEDIFHSKR